MSTTDYIRTLREALEKHHKWHQDSSILLMLDGGETPFVIDAASQYVDSSLYAITEKALALPIPTPPHAAALLEEWGGIKREYAHPHGGIDEGNLYHYACRLEDALRAGILEPKPVSVEAVARAICVAQHDNPDLNYDDGWYAWHDFVEQAKAAIEACGLTAEGE